jgi:DNA invertase Pin-like site-specific DNA recombinase
MARKRNLEKAVGYVRTSSATNVGQDKDSEKRQRAAIEAFAKRGGFELIARFNDRPLAARTRLRRGRASRRCSIGSRAMVSARSLSRMRRASLANW